MLLKPKHTFESVARELVEGLRSGNLSLAGPTAEEIPLQDAQDLMAWRQEALPQAAEPLAALSKAQEASLRALDVMARDACQGIERLYATVAEQFGRLLGATFCSLWEVCPRAGSMDLQAFWPLEPAQLPTVTEVNVADCVSGRAVSEHCMWRFQDIPGQVARGNFLDAPLVERLGIQTMLSLPVLNTYNINQPEVLVNAFFDGPMPEVDDRLLEDLAEHVAILVERAWNEMRLLIADEFGHVAGGCRTVKQLLDKLCERVAINGRCPGVSVFLVDETGERLECRETTGLVGGTRPGDVTYARNEGLPGKAWGLNQIYVSRRATEEEADDPNTLEDIGVATDAVMVMPIRNLLGEVVGVIRCRGKLGQSPGLTSHFSVTDEIVLSTLAEAASPYLQMMVATERRTRAMTRITHELKIPISVTLGAVDFIKDEMSKNGWKFSEDYVGDIQGYMELMGGLLGKTAFLRPDMTVARSQRVFLYRDVVLPAVRQVRLLLKERGFSPRRIDCSKVKTVPPMYLDKARFQQVFFNLLSNAIKYAFDDPHAFRVEIDCHQVAHGSEIRFRDWGPGIDQTLGEAIFKEGVRGRDAYRSNVAGDGFGCYLVSEIVRLHGGRVELTSNGHPTEFSLLLPFSLKYPPHRVRA